MRGANSAEERPKHQNPAISSELLLPFVSSSAQVNAQLQTPSRWHRGGGNRNVNRLPGKVGLFLLETTPAYAKLRATIV